MSKHTPTPWQFSTSLTRSAENPDPKGAVIYSEDFSGNIAQIDDNEDGRFEANAAYIVKACNAFPALVEALEFCLSKIGQPHSIEIKDDLEKIETLLHSLKSEG